MIQPYIAAEEAVLLVESGNRVYIHGGAATPIPLIEALLARWSRPALRGSELQGSSR